MIRREAYRRRFCVAGGAGQVAVRFRLRSFTMAVSALCFVMLSAVARAEGSGVRGLPDSPGWVLGGGQAAGQQLGSASVAGVVLDISGAAVADATVTLTQEGAPERVLRSEAHGEFLFPGLAAGTYRMTIAAKGLQTLVSDTIILRAGEHRELPRIALPVEGANASVSVTVTQDELAQEQVKAEVQQRVFGVLPNFYSSYLWNAAPLKAKHKFELAFRSLSDPVQFIGTGVAAGIEQANNTFPDYGQGAVGYGKRYGAAYGDEVLTRMLGSAVLPSVLHQDPRYFYLGTGSMRQRAWYAVTRAVVTRQDSGRAAPNYSRIVGSAAAGAISYTYHPDADRGAGLIGRNVAIGVGGQAVSNLIREFILRKIVTKVPDYEQGKAAAVP